MGDVAKPIFGEIKGRIGQISIPSLGVVVGTTDSWLLKRRENPGPNEGAWEFHAVLSYINPLYFGDEDLEPLLVFTVTIGTRPDGSPNIHRLDKPFVRMALNGRSLDIQGATLCRVDPENP